MCSDITIDSIMMTMINLMKHLYTNWGINLDKIIRNVNTLLWREVKAQAALEGKSMTEWVEEIIEQALNLPQVISDGDLENSKVRKNTDSTKLIRNMNDRLWREAKAQAALSGKSMKDWVEGVIANGLARKKLIKKVGQKGSASRSKYISSGKTKIIRSINEQLWREAKACAALDGKSMKDWVEGVIARALTCQDAITDNILKKYRPENNPDKTKILRNVEEQLWREVKARAALDGKSMKDWVEGVIALALIKYSKN
jgi:predicted HicB family RNase H-like nuclease